MVALAAALLFAPRPIVPDGFAPDHRRSEPSFTVPTAPRFAFWPRTSACDGGDGSGRGTPSTPASSPGSWVLSEDYPASALLRSQQGRSRFRLAVDADGAVMACTITASSGVSALDAAACDALTRRARFEPARDGQGCPIPSGYSSSVLWRIPKV